MERSVSYASRVGVKAENAVQLVESIRKGLPYRAFDRLQHEMGVTTAELAGLVEIPARTLARRRTEGRLQSDESERLLRASRIYDDALGLFEGEDYPVADMLSERGLYLPSGSGLSETQIGQVCHSLKKAQRQRFAV